MPECLVHHDFLYSLLSVYTAALILIGQKVLNNCLTAQLRQQFYSDILHRDLLGSKNM